MYQWGGRDRSHAVNYFGVMSPPWDADPVGNLAINMRIP